MSMIQMLIKQYIHDDTLCLLMIYKTLWAILRSDRQRVSYRCDADNYKYVCNNLNIQKIVQYYSGKQHVHDCKWMSFCKNNIWMLK